MGEILSPKVGEGKDAPDFDFRYFFWGGETKPLILHSLRSPATDLAYFHPSLVDIAWACPAPCLPRPASSFPTFSGSLYNTRVLSLKPKLKFDVSSWLILFVSVACVVGV